MPSSEKKSPNQNRNRKRLARNAPPLLEKKLLEKGEALSNEGRRKGKKHLPNTPRDSVRLLLRNRGRLSSPGLSADEPGGERRGGKRCGNVTAQTGRDFLKPRKEGPCIRGAPNRG